MKALIWILCFFVATILNTLLGYATGVKVGYLIFYFVVYFVARKLCDKWDEHKNKKQSKTVSVADDEENNDKINSCRKCGEPLIDSSKFCRKCGHRLLVDSEYCANCGTTVEYTDDTLSVDNVVIQEDEHNTVISQSNVNKKRNLKVLC